MKKAVQGVVQHGSRRAASTCRRQGAEKRARLTPWSITAVNSYTPHTSSFPRDASPANASALACRKCMVHDRCGQAAICCTRQHMAAHPHWHKPLQGTKKKTVDSAPRLRPPRVRPPRIPPPTDSVPHGFGPGRFQIQCFLLQRVRQHYLLMQQCFFLFS